MKLYTEEQVRKAIRDTRYFTSVDSENDIINNMVPIELPSDEEINHESEGTFVNTIEMYEEGFIDGAKWVIDKIKGGEQ